MPDKKEESKKNRTMFFIDGNNIYKTLSHMGIKLSPKDYINLITFICKGFKEIHHIDLEYTNNNVHYYNSIPSINDGKEAYEKHMDFINAMKSLFNDNVTTRPLQYNSNEEIIAKKHELLEDLKLCKGCESVIKKTCSECIGIVKKREKGIDVAIAIDMVKFAYEDKFDYCVLISGDADFIPALNLVKKLGKKPLSSFILSKSYAYHLRQEFQNFFIKRENFEFDIQK